MNVLESAATGGALLLANLARFVKAMLSAVSKDMPKTVPQFCAVRTSVWHKSLTHVGIGKSFSTVVTDYGEIFHVFPLVD